MVNFRYHLVSLIAVFLALAVGIGLGATVLDKVTVDTLRDRISQVEKTANDTRRQNSQLSDQVARDQDFANQTADLAVVEQLVGRRVLIIGMRGIDRGPVDALVKTLTNAGADLQGTIWFTRKFTLQNTADASLLADILGVNDTDPDTIRKDAIAQLSRAWAGEGGRNALVDLQTKGFVDVDPPPNTQLKLAEIPRPGTNFVIASDSSPDLPNDQWAIPFTTALTQANSIDQVVAVEPGKPAQGKSPEVRAAFVGPLRSADVAGHLSTVDDLEDVHGRLATVFALRELASGKTGHFGFGPGAESLMPTPLP
jgi:hypothetical protein